MDAFGTDHSDSDSGESWILLEQERNSPTHEEQAPEFGEEPGKRNIQDDKEDDTDGISIISDSEHDSIPCEILNENNLEQDDHPGEEIPEYIAVDPLHHDDGHYDTIRNDEDFLGDTNGKMKTYVHRRNKRLSTVLNVIVLGSVITAAGIAIGHMWGVRDDCSVNSTPSVNKILSNLYKLQEENAHLRSKLKELTLYNNLYEQKLDSPQKQHRCKKVFEEPLENKNVAAITKCVDGQNKPFVNHVIESDYEREFLNDMKKLKEVYKHNRTWLDEEINKRLKHEQMTVKAMKAKYNKQNYIMKDVKKDQQLEINNNNVEHVTDLEENPELNVLDIPQAAPEKKITYADSLKLDKESKRIHKRETNEHNNYPKNYYKKKTAKDYDIVSENSFAEGQPAKDVRHVGQKHKMQQKKQDRQKLNKKQKRKNKYEQWEMKGGYLKYYDDVSTTSSQENFVNNPYKTSLDKKNELNDYLKQFPGAKDNVRSLTDLDDKTKLDEKKTKFDEKDSSDWYNKRATLRNEARKMLEKELFGDHNPNSASWYFRRMQRREKYRIKSENSTHKRQSKRNMNFKTRF